MEIKIQRDIDRYYTALIEKDKQFVGIFYVGVKTTGIFCIATCTARKPKKENVVFFHKMKDCLKDGYRPCKICKPTTSSNELPSYIVLAHTLLSESDGFRVSDQDLRNVDLSPEKIRRWFNKTHSMTFQAYQRMVRINAAYQSLKNGNNIGYSAHQSGYDSLSGFSYTYKKVLGNAPSNKKQKNVILISRLLTPLGPMWACATEKGVCLLEFTDRRMLETEFEDLQHRLDAVILAGKNKHIEQLDQELKEYFDGKRRIFEVSLHTPTTPFRMKVWNKLLEIPYGETTSYKEQSVRIGNPNAVRAVANANGHNRVAIVIPCHRVIGSDGSLTGYAGGLDRKKWLLQHEGAYDGAQQLTIFDN